MPTITTTTSRRPLTLDPYPIGEPRLAFRKRIDKYEIDQNGAVNLLLEEAALVLGEDVEHLKPHYFDQVARLADHGWLGRFVQVFPRDTTPFEHVVYTVESLLRAKNRSSRYDHISLESIFWSGSTTKRDLQSEITGDLPKVYLMPYTSDDAEGYDPALHYAGDFYDSQVEQLRADSTRFHDKYHNLTLQAGDQFAYLSAVIQDLILGKDPRDDGFILSLGRARFPRYGHLNENSGVAVGRTKNGLPKLGERTLLAQESGTGFLLLVN